MKPDTARDRLRELIFGFGLSRCIYAAAELGVADSIARGPKTCEDLAKDSRSDPMALRRLLGALERAGLLEEDDERRFRLTEMGQLLRTDSADSMRAEILHMLGPTSWASWGGLVHSIRTGRPAFEKIFGEDPWKYRQRHSELGEAFDAMAKEMAERQTSAILALLDLEGVGLIVDVGGGRGELLAGILRENPSVSGVLFDSPNVVAGAGPVLEAAGVRDRCRVESGDFFVDVPDGGDLYLLKAILHNWRDDEAAAVLNNCRKAMSRGARIVIVESALDPDEKAGGSFMDIHMLVVHGGRERTLDEFSALLEASGFHPTPTAKTDIGLILVEGTAS